MAIIKKLDVKLEGNRFTYDPETLDDFHPVALQARMFCGPSDGVVFMKLTPGAIEELYRFLEQVIRDRFDGRLERAVSFGKKEDQSE